MKMKFAIAAILIALQAPLALAGGGQHGKHDPAQRMEHAQQRMQETIDELDLTEEQKAQAQPIIEQSLQKQKAILNNYGFTEGGERPELSRKEKRKLGKELREVRQQSKAQLDEILTEEQQQKLEEIREQRRAEYKEKRKAMKEQKANS